MNQQKYIDDLRDIKDIMNRSTRFISLSGLSGVFAGTFALVAAYTAYIRVFTDQGAMSYHQHTLSGRGVVELILIAGATLVLSLCAGVYFTAKETRRRNQKLWDRQSKLVLINLAIPLVAGGLLCLILLLQGYVGIVAPLTLIFYGLALVNAGKYTLPEVRWLGLTELALGLIAAYYIGFGLVFWALGFGIAHIAYGTAMHIRYKS